MCAFQSSAAFSNVVDATAWASAVQLALNNAPWPTDCLELEPFAVQEDCAGNTLFAGPRLQMGITWCGAPTDRARQGLWLEGGVRDECV